MVYSIVRAFAFDADYDEILGYLVTTLQSPRAALNLINKADEAAELLSHNPYLCALSDKQGFRERGLREKLVLNYVIIYKIAGKEVIFLRFFHQTQLYDHLVMEWS